MIVKGSTEKFSDLLKIVVMLMVKYTHYVSTILESVNATLKDSSSTN